MQISRLASAMAISGLLLSGCSTRPRNFAAEVSTPVTDRMAFENDYRTCDGLVRAGHKSGFRTAGTTAAISAGAVGGGVGAFAATTGGTASGWSGIGAGLGTAAAAATMAVGVVGFGLTRAIRGGREHRFKERMTSCLGEYGYQVTDWEKLRKKDDSAAFASRHVRVSETISTPTETATQDELPGEAGPYQLGLTQPTD